MTTIKVTQVTMPKDPISEEIRKAIDNSITDIIAAHVARAQHNHYPGTIDELYATGNTRCNGTRKQLVPNLNNPALMDVAEITTYSAEFVKRYKFPRQGHKRARKNNVWYQVYQEAKRVEIGSYWDKR